MIVKKVAVARGARAKSKALHVRDLCDYIAGAGGGHESEKVEHRGSVNLLNSTHDEQVQEIGDLAEVGKRSPQPVQHWIFSWQEGEQPTAGQVDEAVRVFLAELGLGEHQALYALHRDTDNWHLHLAVNRVHPETEKVVTVNRGFDLEVAHRALARIEHAQGWGRERLGRYRITGGGAVERATSARNRAGQPRGRVRDGEIRSGEKSAQRIAIEEAAPILRQARTWPALHRELASKGMRIEAKGSGAVVWVGPIAVKASVAGRDCSMAALERRLGEYVGPPVGVSVAWREPQALLEGMPGWSSYTQERQRHGAEKAAGQAELRAKQTVEVLGMRRQHLAERRRMFDRGWGGKGRLLNAMRSLLAAEHSIRKTALQQRQRQERTDVRERFGRFPDFEEWLRRKGGPELAQRWRHGAGLSRDPIDCYSRPPPLREGRQSIGQIVPAAGESGQGAGRSSGGEGERQARASYERHLAEILRNPESIGRDPSRIDLEIAIRMRVTGHARIDVQRAIEESAAEARPVERRDWKEYARRTVATAFGPPRDREIERVPPSRTRWLRVEGERADERIPQPVGSEDERER
jgi:hypothetical protein